MRLTIATKTNCDHSLCSTPGQIARNGLLAHQKSESMGMIFLQCSSAKCRLKRRVLDARWSLSMIDVMGVCSV